MSLGHGDGVALHLLRCGSCGLGGKSGSKHHCNSCDGCNGERFELHVSKNTDIPKMQRLENRLRLAGED